MTQTAPTPPAVPTYCRSECVTPELWSALAKCLALYGWRLRAMEGLPGTRYLSTSHAEGYALYEITDNGGELMVGRPNSGVLFEDVPLTVWGAGLDVGTIAYRVACVVKGEPVDYHSLHPDLWTYATQSVTRPYRRTA